MKHVPVRQCMVCHEKNIKRTFFRIVRFPLGHIEYDRDHKKPGRGFYICQKLECVIRARKKQLFEHVFPERISQNLYMILAKELKKDNKSLSSLLGFAVRSKNAVTGVEPLMKNCRKGKCHLIIMEPCSGNSTRKKIEQMSRLKNIPLFIYQEEKPLEQIVGKASCRCVGITDKAFAEAILIQGKQEKEQ
jgi:predicted RNA-binding protein YlxR (DUF448 family)/ribosomal protein L30E